MNDYPKNKTMQSRLAAIMIAHNAMKRTLRSVQTHVDWSNQRVSEVLLPQIEEALQAAELASQAYSED